MILEKSAPNGDKAVKKLRLKEKIFINNRLRKILNLPVADKSKYQRGLLVVPNDEFLHHDAIGITKKVMESRDKTLVHVHPSR